MLNIAIRATAYLLGACFVIAFGLGADIRLTTALIVALTVFLWATLLVPEYFTALLFIAVVLVFGIADADGALAGFKSKAVWLVFAGMVFGAAIQKHSVGSAVFDRLLRQLPTYTVLIWMVSVFGLLLSFVIPSAMGRVVLTAPLAIALCGRLGVGETSSERYGIYLAAISSATLPAFTILTSNVPNVVLLGAMETAYGHGISYGDYFILNFPVLGLGIFLLLPALILRLFPGRIARQKEAPPPAPWTVDQMKLMAVLLVTLLLWASDNYHGISAAWIGLAAAIVCLAPGFGILAPATVTKLNFGPWFFVAGAIGLGAIVRENGLGLTLSDYIVSGNAIDQWAPPFQYAALVIANMLLSVFTTLPAAPSVFTPLAASLADTFDWSLDGMIMTQVASFVLVALPYQAPPILVGLTLLNIPLRKAMRLFAASSLAGLVVLVPLHYLWGHFLGYFP